MGIPEGFKLTSSEYEELVNIVTTCKGYGHPLTEKIKDLKGVIIKELP